MHVTESDSQCGNPFDVLHRRLLQERMPNTGVMVQLEVISIITHIVPKWTCYGDVSRIVSSVLPARRRSMNHIGLEGDMFALATRGQRANAAIQSVPLVSRHRVGSLSFEAVS